MVKVNFHFISPVDGLCNGHGFLASGFTINSLGKACLRWKPRVSAWYVHVLIWSGPREMALQLSWLWAVGFDQLHIMVKVNFHFISPVDGLCNGHGFLASGFTINSLGKACLRWKPRVSAWYVHVLIWSGPREMALVILVMGGRLRSVARKWNKVMGTTSENQSKSWLAKILTSVELRLKVFLRTLLT